MSSELRADMIQDSIMKPNLEASTRPFSSGRGWASGSVRERGREREREGERGRERERERGREREREGERGREREGEREIRERHHYRSIDTVTTLPPSLLPPPPPPCTDRGRRSGACWS